jgi:hypothetical protein
MKVGCLIFWDDDRYDQMGEIAAASFKKFHEDVELFVVRKNDVRKDYMTELSTFIDHGPGILKFAIGYTIFAKKGLDKLIILGADTITLHRMDEFLNNNDHDILTTLDFKYACHQNGILLSNHNTHYNADVVCFNNRGSLIEIIKQSLQFGKINSRDENIFAEQGGLNYVCNVTGTFTHFCVDSESEEVCYNVKSKGRDPVTPSVKEKKFYILNDKVYTSNGILVKCYHYCSGFGVNEHWKDLYAEQNKMLGEEFINHVEKISGIKV